MSGLNESLINAFGETRSKSLRTCSYFQRLPRELEVLVPVSPRRIQNRFDNVHKYNFQETLKINYLHHVELISAIMVIGS